MIGERIPPDVARELRAITLWIATRFGDPDPTSIAAVNAKHPDALDAINGGKVPSRENERTYLVFMTGTFTSPRGNPLGGRIPTGRYLTVLINPSTLRHTDLSIGERPPQVPLEALGPVSDLTEQS